MDILQLLGLEDSSNNTINKSENNDQYKDEYITYLDKFLNLKKINKSEYTSMISLFTAGINKNGTL